MAEERTHDSTFEDAFFNKLKSVDIQTLEQAIAKAVSNLVGVELTCSIDKINYERVPSSMISAKFDVSIHEPFKGFGMSEPPSE